MAAESEHMDDPDSRLKDELKRAKEDLISMAGDIDEISTPVIEIWSGVLVLPLIGTLDSHRARQCTEAALSQLLERSARVLIVDITGVPVVDTMVANYLMKMAMSVQLMGGTCIVTGISPRIAMTIVSMGIDLGGTVTRASLADGLKAAFAEIGVVVQAS